MRPRFTTHRARAAACSAITAAALFGHGLLFAQALNDVPMAVKNNTAPNFVFMIDNSGSMSNIVPESPYNAALDYTPAGCNAGNRLGNGSTINLNVSSGKPYINGTTNTLLGSGYGSANKCFTKGTVYSGKLLADSGGAPSGYLPADYDGNFLNWYFGSSDGPFPVAGWTNRKKLNAGAVRTRIEIAKASASSVIGGLPVTVPASVRAGLVTYNTATSGDGGELRVSLGDFTAAQRTSMLNGVNALTPSGNTPLAETLADIGRYLAAGYSGNVSAGRYANVNIDTFLKQDGRKSCLRNANCLSGTTDAVPAKPSDGTPARPIQYWCQRSYAFLMTDGRPQGDQAFQNNAYLRDYDGDCTGVNAANCTGSFDMKKNRDYESEGSDYLDDVANALYDVDLRPNLVSPDPVSRPKSNNLRTYAIGFADLQVQNDPLLISTAKEGGGKFLSAQDGNTLTKAFNDVVSDAFSKDAGAAAVAVANAQITLNNIGYASSYKSGSWYGDLVAYSLDTSTALQTGADLWSLRVNLDAQAAANRKIATFDGSFGVAFAAGLAYAGKPASLTDGVIAYLRGDRSGEPAPYRARQSVLGDIINAEPVVVNYPGNVPIIFQGANDGMLHVVDGRTDAAVGTRGQELWAYVPKLLHPQLAGLSDPNYAHKYLLDGTPAAAELTGVAGVSRILVGSLGKGGRGYYALNISTYAAATQADAAAKPLWEFAPANMGYSFGSPLVVKTAAGWRVVVASGYRNGSNVAPEPSGDGHGRVWILDPASGAVLATIDTGAGTAASPAGLAHLSRLANAAPDAIVRFVYGGDLLGNVWRFDLDTASARRIAALTDATGAAQAVTSPPEVGPISGNPSKYLVMLGTGRYLADEDVPGVGANAQATQQQSVYGLIDDTAVAAPALPSLRGTNGNACPANGGDGDLVCQGLTFMAASNTYQATTHAVNPATRRGWYLDLPVDGRMDNARVVSKPSLTTGGTLVLTANIPTNTTCDPGGRSWYLALNASTGGAVARNVGGNTYYDAAYFLGYALASRTVIVITAGGKRALIRMSDKTTQAPAVPEPAATAAQWRRIYWRQIKN